VVVVGFDDSEALVSLLSKVLVAKVDLCNVDTFFVGSQSQNNHKQRKKGNNFHF